MITVDATKFSQRIQEWQKAAGVGAAQAVKTQAKLFVDSCVNKLTPPRTLAKGEAQVSKSLKMIFGGVEQGLLDTIGSEHGTTNIDAWFTTKAGHRKHILWERLDANGQGMRKWHKEYWKTPRIEKGKYNKDEWRRRYVVSWQDFGKYLERVKKSVGRLRAGWLPAAKVLNVNVPAWVIRHSGGSKGTITFNLGEGYFDKPSITITNYASGVGKIEDVVKKALKIRLSAMAKDMKLYIAGIKEKGK